MTRILIVEDEPDIASVLQDYLRHAGYETEDAADGQTALERMLAAPPDLTLLDVMLPRLDGVQVLKQARVHIAHPIIMLTARIEEIDRLVGLEAGADDYVCKPFSPREVVARVRAVLRRTGNGGASGNGPAGVGVGAAERVRALLLDDVHWRASLHGTPLNLTRREFGLLQALARHPGRIFSRGRLLELAYDDTADVTERAVDSHIKNLRRKLSVAAPEHDWIRSVYGVGFAFEPPSP